MTDLEHAALNMGKSKHGLLIKIAEELKLPNPQDVVMVWLRRIAAGDMPEAVERFLHDASSTLT